MRRCRPFAPRNTLSLAAATGVLCALLTRSLAGGAAPAPPSLPAAAQQEAGAGSLGSVSALHRDHDLATPAPPPPSTAAPPPAPRAPALSHPAPPARAPFSPPVQGCGSSAVARTLALLNQDRRAVGAAPLVLDGSLCNAARIHILMNARNDAMSHSGLMQAVSQAGVQYHTIGEVLGFCRPTLDPGFINSMWMQSSEHHAIIDDGRFVRVGIAWAQSQSGAWYVSAIVDD